MTTFARASVTAGARPLERKYYTDETIYQREIERIFGKRWICVGRSEQIAKPGDYFLFDLGEESVIVVRDRNGLARAHINVCRHRGTRLCSTERGQFAGSIQCPYHAWTFGLDGKLLAARNMRDVPEFDKNDYPLFGASLVEWDGFLMLNLSADPEPFEQAFATLLGKWTNWRPSEVRIGATIDYEVQANWKLIIENYSECYHCPIIHPALVAISPPETGKNDLMEGPFLGGPMALIPNAHSMTVGGKTARMPIRGLPVDDHQRVYYYALFPNTLLSLHPDYVMVHILRPLGPRRTFVRCMWMFEPEVLEQSDFDGQDAVQFWDMTNREDWHACEISQLGINSRFYQPGPYAQSEGLLWAFDRYYVEALEGPK